MSRYLDRAIELRATVVPHYNCAQSVIVPFAEAAGIPEETVMRMAANFAAGMKRASVCGAVTGGLMVLGMFGIDDGPTIAAFYRRLQDNHEGCLDCGELLAINHRKGLEKKPHCDAMVYEAVQLVEEILREKGKEI